MVRFYAAEQVHAALPFARLIDALAQAFARGAQVPLRHVHRLNDDDLLLLMPAWRNESAAAAGALGVKLVTVMPGAAARGASTVAATYLLLDRATGELRAVLDGEALTLRRTAAASALAARYMARADATHLLVIGAGKLAPYMLRAHCAARPALVHVRLWARNRERAAAAAQRLRDEGLPVDAATDLEAAVREAHIVSCATTATTPVVRGAWLAPGTHLDLVGGFTPQMREADDEAVARARIVVDTYAGALAEAGDLVQPLAAGVIARENVVAELAQLVRGEVAGRTSEGEITLFKSVGTALEDLAAAELVVCEP
ncbi:MAG TPA: ornithine cyclodeaminase family protein [Burkholderiaceae bacterium]|jgi:ornithine cyclodeaminase|nr:ornithine cyclodeaminase family protein [Burkholderiaceae bacterium]